MNYSMFATAVGALALTACGQQDFGGERSANALEATAPAQVYSGTGTVTAIAGDQVTIDHGPIEGIGWPAMTMAFTAPPGVASGVEVGSEVSFAFHQDGSTNVLTSLETR